MATAPKNAPKSTYRPPISNKLATTPINHFMSRKVIYATPSTTVTLAIKMMLTHKISGLIVIDDSNSCLGVYSEVDAVLQGASGPLDVPIRYTKPPIAVLPDRHFRDVLILMAQKKLKRLPIVDDRKKVVGIVARRDLMKAIFDDVAKQMEENQ